MKQLFIIAYSDDLQTPEIETFYSNHKAVKRVGELVASEYDVKPEADQTLISYVSDYYEFVREENDNMCSLDINYKIIDL